MKEKEEIDFIPLRNDVLLEKIEIKEMSIIKAPKQAPVRYDSYYQHPFQGKIVALPKAYDREYVRIKKRLEIESQEDLLADVEIDMLIDFRIGDIVALEENSGKYVVIKGKKYILVRDYEILGIIKKA